MYKKNISIEREMSISDILLIKKAIEKDKNLLFRTDVDGRSLLLQAVGYNHIELSKFLIDSGAYVNHQDHSKNGALHYCAEFYCYEIAEYLLNHGAKLNMANKYGNEPLWTAVGNIKRGLVGIDLVKLFIRQGADANHINKVEKSPMSFALELGIQQIIDTLNGK